MTTLSAHLLLAFARLAIRTACILLKPRINWTVWSVNRERVRWDLKPLSRWRLQSLPLFIVPFVVTIRRLLCNRRRRLKEECHR